MRTNSIKYFLIYGLTILCLIPCLNANENDSIRINNLNDEKVERTIFKTLQAEKIQTITIHTAINKLVADKRTNNIHAAKLTYTTLDGTVINKSIELKPRGKSRRKYCDFPPLQVRFSKKELNKKGISSNHKKLKLVTHCLDGYTANSNVLKEYLAYQIYQELTPKSMNAQLLKVRYEDTQSKEVLERYAILLEDIDELAVRLEGKEIEAFNKKLNDLEAEDRAIFTLFQYMIGNDDWDLIAQRNIKLVQPENKKKLIPIPYDFDSAGLVSTAYAKPNRNQGLESVQQRLFMGKFSNKKERQEVIGFFNSKKENIYQLVNEFEEMDKLTKIEVTFYLDSFYKTLNTPQLVKKAFPVNGRQPVLSDLEGEMH